MESAQSCADTAVAIDKAQRIVLRPEGFSVRYSTRVCALCRAGRGLRLRSGLCQIMSMDTRKKRRGILGSAGELDRGVWRSGARLHSVQLRHGLPEPLPDGLVVSLLDLVHLADGVGVGGCLAPSLHLLPEVLGVGVAHRAGMAGGAVCVGGGQGWHRKVDQMRCEVGVRVHRVDRGRQGKRKVSAAFETREEVRQMGPFAWVYVGRAAVEGPEPKLVETAKKGPNRKPHRYKNRRIIAPPRRAPA